MRHEGQPGRNGVMKRIVTGVVGVIAVLLGLVWFGQGIGLLPGSVMTGDPKWAVIGAILALGGGWLLWYGFGRFRGDPNGPPGQH